MTKALPLLTGGRGVPDMLVIKYLRPDIVFNLTTTQGLKAAESLKQFASLEFDVNIEILPAIDPFKENEIKTACKNALIRLPDAEWIIHFTSSPKIVGIYAHEVARDMNIPCWFLDTDGKQVISLVKDTPVDNEGLFKASVKEYIGAYGRTYEIPKSPSYRKEAEGWYPVARELALNPNMAQILLAGVKGNKLLTHTVDAKIMPLLRQLEAMDALTIEYIQEENIIYTIKSINMQEFLQGDWLEVYVWYEAVEAGFANDCQWGYKIRAELPSNELDLALTYKARLLIAECKTLSKPFNPELLYKLHSVADLVGGNYVRQIFITNHVKPNDKNESFENFSQQAAIRRTCVVTGEQLPEIKEILRQQLGVGVH